MPSLALIRDQWLNLWDIGNYYGVINHGVDLYVCGTGKRPPWDDIKRLYPQAKVVKYKRPWEPLELEPDVIDVPDPHYTFSQYYAKRHDRCVVVGWDNLPGKNGFGDARGCIQNAWKFAARSTLASDTLIWDGADPEKIQIIPGAVDTEFFHPGEGKRHYAVLFVGRVTLEKGLLDLIWAMRGLGAELWIAGEGDRSYFEPWIERAGIEAKWLGFLSRDELAEAYRQAKVLCVPSIPKLDKDPFACWLEQFGQVFIEAMASGLPVVSTYSGAIPEVVHGAGRLVGPRDWRSMRANLGVLLNRTNQWVSYSQAARYWAETKYSQDVVGKQIKEWYF
jgi:glycosyltransferase involved in cell wall biosynthesis